MCWGLLLESASSRPLTPPTPIPQSFSRIRKWLGHARSSPSLTILAGGQCDDSVGYFVEPCIVETKDPQDTIMKEVMGLEGRGGGSVSGCFPGRHPVSQLRTTQPCQGPGSPQGEQSQALRSGLLTPDP